MQSANPTATKGIGRQQGKRRHALIVALLILFTGLGVAWMAKYWIEADIAAESAERLDRLASRVRNTIEQRFRTPVYGLRGLRASYFATGEMSRG